MMRTLLLFTLFVAVHSPLPAPLLNSDFDEAWKDFKARHEKHYDDSEDGARRYIWERNVEMVMDHNLEADMGIHSYWLAVNKFADWTKEELKNFRKCVFNETSRGTGEQTFVHKLDFNLPLSVDWRKQGYVTSVKDQEACGSCWAFSAVGSLEGQHKAKTGNLASLSEQNLIDCSWKEGNKGCNGGWMTAAFDYVKKNGINTERAYPYRGTEGHCNFNSSIVEATCRGYAVLPPGDEKSLQAAAATIGPISVAIDATDKFMFYKSGIFYDPSCSSKSLNHGVLVVGYGSKNGQDYWIVKNSWGQMWGSDGYVLMARNKNNSCGIATKASYPLM